ncbi:MAG: His-Xaa-Ser system radical SAM maturase HxsB [Candidatus Omnitrophica bacterium]|nr:His-Xaa-Ser system radical SAM maturase HxsB [Candidatus Omnitrophota bacterium]MDD5352619.1 His-Xaa-Ser system radical SAM maturase HxsB [Candidatus Omnitrophota bacterium]MDD5550218.1 His-Xaa-Ser system radical SAM maturase HxsB [Candidatus Omnitrophota bacterium]
MPLELKDINKEKVGFFRFKKLNGEYLLTNDMGGYCFLDPIEFDLFLIGKIEDRSPNKYSELIDKGFIRDRLDFNGLTSKYASRNMFLGSGPSLHIVVVTLRCDHKCIYCQSGAKDLDSTQYDMDSRTAEKVVDRIFESPNSNITIEFQGGEPLVNFDTIKFIVEYANKKNKSAKKKLLISLVSNLTYMNKKILTFLIKNNVSFCTSLDGPEILHNKNRIVLSTNNNSYKNTIKWIKRIRGEVKKHKTYKYRLNALTTITKYSLSYPREIIDEFVALGLDGIHLRPVNPFGIREKTRQKISFSAEDFLDFYKEALDYIMVLNFKGHNFYERTAKIFLQKILTNRDPNYLEIRSPCGAGTGQLAYNFNGDVYTCDEGRMFSVMGDDTFRLGNVNKNKYQEFIDNEIVKILSLSSCLDGIPSCSDCVYKPYCGTCPLYNYVIEGNIFLRSPTNDRCRINMSILDYIFELLSNPEAKAIFEKWLGIKKV